MMWDCLPHILLEDIYFMLSVKQRYYCSMVCRHWYEVFNSPRVWRRLVVGERTFTYRRFNLYKGYQYELSHHRVQMCLGRIGHYIQEIDIKPIWDYHNLYEFMTVLASFLNFFDKFPMPLLQSFEFEFACENFGVGSQGTGIILGTGGKILEKLKTLLGNLMHLRELRLHHLLLSDRDAPYLLDNVVNTSRGSLQVLELINLTMERYTIFQISMFPHLCTLVITPPQISDDSLLMLVRNAPLLDLVLVEDHYTPDHVPIFRSTWKQVKKMAPNLQVTLEVRGRKSTDVTLQPSAPVSCIVYRSRRVTLNSGFLYQVAEEYKNTLECVVQCATPRRHGLRSFSERADSALVYLIRQCPRLHTLILRDRISTTTLLIVASESKSLETLSVRRNAILKRSDWPMASSWSSDFYTWLRVTSRDYDLVDKEIARILNTKWRMLTDMEYRRASAWYY